MTAGMILSSADILRILGRNEVIRLSAQVSIVDGKPALSGREGIYIYINRFPVLDEFEATWQIWIESDEEDDLIVAEIKRLLPRVQVSGGLMTTVFTTEFRSDNTQKAPEAPKPAQAQVDLTAFEERFQELVEDVQDRMLLVTSGRPGKDGRDGRPGEPGRPGRDVLATEANLEDLQNVSQGIAKEKGQVLTWDGNEWTNLYIPERHGIAGGGGESVQSDWNETDPQEPSFILNKPSIPSVIDDLTDVTAPTPQEGQALVWNEANSQWEPADVSNGSLIVNGEWRFSSQTTGSPASGYVFWNNADPLLATELYIHEINNNGKDVGVFLQELIQPGSYVYVQDSRDSDNAVLFLVTSNPVDNGTFKTVLVTPEASQGSIVNNKIVAVSLLGGGGAGGGATIIDDLLDVDTVTTAPQIGDVLAWDGSNWVPSTVAGGGGIPEAPQDGNYYVRQNGAWVNLATALTQVVTPDSNVDGADFTQQITTAVNSIIYDGGDFTNGGSAATDNTFLDGEVFSPAFDDTVIDGGNASV